MKKNKRAIGTFIVFLLVTFKIHATPNKDCEQLCFPDKIYTQCTSNTRSLSAEEQRTCDQMTVDCQTCTENKKAQTHKTEHYPCQDICDTQKLLECNKDFKTLTTEQKSFCTQMTSVCQDCPQRDTN